ncbi:hypothetical protein SAMN05444405_10485 [Bacteroides luti]|uniref:Uncharacterized protein n=1 Tax=Bacteroides luti TaxID=1297750 RepID=A0A1M4XNB7_9BACE|nr:hypothetical protein [Bacteroides luti]SHE95087.1 hypothetical protein SAMN05444405_10485 [Bacteroides luti]
MRLKNNFLKEVQEAQVRGDTQLHRIGIRINNQVKGEFKAENFTDKLIKDYANTRLPISLYIEAETDRLKNIYSALKACYGALISECEGAGIIGQYLDFISKDGINILSPKENESISNSRFNNNQFSRSFKNEGLEYVYKILLDKGYIEEALHDDFYYVFGNIIDKPKEFHKIVWKKELKALATFINAFTEDFNRWAIAQNCFLINGKTISVGSIKSSVSGKKLHKDYNFFKDLVADH